jgi:hypothetical protein
MLFITALLPPFLILSVIAGLTLDTLYFVQVYSLILCIVIGYNWPERRKSELYTLALMAPTIWCTVV